MIWLVGEQYEDYGTDVFVVLSVWPTKEQADTEVEELQLEHGWNGETYSNGEDEDECWCLCHRQDWFIEGHAVKGV